ncbi:putative bifunctional diguanylate cyclase/phosphodiesterase [Seohaeicola nanhaiensis]|uniref:Bifunctional diguanylate cyclase/phosphodiesterase n=1 Tax=Seohaeicola nanhaiensis TaxID=1387282 RepID=A0ABV9KJR3_9RHOB
MRLSSLLSQFRDWIAPGLTGPPLLAFLPALSLGAFWLGGERALLVASLGLPLLFTVAGTFGLQSVRPPGRDQVTGLLGSAGFEAEVERIGAELAESDLKSACILVDLDEWPEAVVRHGAGAGDVLAQCVAQRIAEALRPADVVARLDDSRFAVCLHPVRQFDLEMCIQLCGRLQVALEEPVMVDGVAVYLSCTVGFCLSGRAPGAGAADWIGAAATALAEARRHGPSSMRSFTPQERRRSLLQPNLRDEAAAALENGQIQPWFQPQISTDTGRVSGFEALARWTHPRHGVIQPPDFLPLLEGNGLIERMGQVTLSHALGALAAWDRAGVQVPSVGVNFTTTELRNPALVDRIKWELDRFDLAPSRLAVEILETVVTDSPDDALTRTVRALGQLGCRIDLDDFGTGQASIAALRRFAIRRIKIDRSFIARADRDPEQQRMIAAILTMAEQLGLDTLGEGVETAGEHALLAQLGCAHVQGFGIARPMPFSETVDWIFAHEATLADAPQIGRGAG